VTNKYMRVNKSHQISQVLALGHGPWQVTLNFLLLANTCHLQWTWAPTNVQWLHIWSPCKMMVRGTRVSPHHYTYPAKFLYLAPHRLYRGEGTWKSENYWSIKPDDGWFFLTIGLLTPSSSSLCDWWIPHQTAKVPASVHGVWSPWQRKGERWGEICLENSS
jgi:hypothetical protein